MIGQPGAGLKQVFSGLNPERIAAAAINNGISRFAISQAAQYAKDRSVWSTPIGAHQGVAHPLAEAYINVQAARLLNARAAQLCDGGEDAAETANMAKFAAAEASLKALDQAIQVHGGNGLSNEYGLSDLWFIARLHRTAPVSRERGGEVAMLADDGLHPSAALYALWAEAALPAAQAALAR